MKFSLIISTLGRNADVVEFIRTIEAQTCRDFEVIIVDQNDDDALGKAVQALTPSYPLKYRHVPRVRGASRGRNLGFELAEGDYVCFPDDDCLYPPGVLDDVLTLFADKGVDMVCGRAADTNGRDINGRFEHQAQAISAANVFSTQIEWMLFFTRTAFEAVSGFDEDVGVGASTPWQANEGQDIVLRMLEGGYQGWYDPALFGHHPELNVVHPDAKMRRKARGYARGMGYVLGRHAYPFAYFARYAIRSAGGVFVSLLRLNGARAAYYLHVTTGRIEGYLGGRRDAGQSLSHRMASLETGQSS